MEVQVNWLAIALATASSMVVGSVWYAKFAFGTMWMKLIKLDPKKAEKSIAKPIIGALIAGFLSAFVLAHVTYLSQNFFDTSFMMAAVQSALWLWLGFSAATLITHNGFEQRPAALTALSVAHELVSLLVMAVIIGWLHP